MRLPEMRAAARSPVLRRRQQCFHRRLRLRSLSHGLPCSPHREFPPTPGTACRLHRRRSGTVTERRQMGSWKDSRVGGCSACSGPAPGLPKGSALSASGSRARVRLIAAVKGASGSVVVKCRFPGGLLSQHSRAGWRLPPALPGLGPSLGEGPEARDASPARP